MTRALVAQRLTPEVWQMIRDIAPAMHQSRLFGANSAEQAMAIMLKGYELGLPLTASFEFIHVIDGRPSLSPRGCLALIHGAGELLEVQIRRSDDTACTVWMRRRDTGFEFTRTWTMQDAVRAKVVKPLGGWEKYPANMLLWRTMGFVADVVCPDLIGGLKRADELGADIDRNGDVIEGSWQQPEQPLEASKLSASPAVPAVVPGISLETLVETYGPDAVMAACDGRIPGTDDEVATVAAALEAANAA